MHQKFGKIAILGRANAGKSTLLNSLVGEKIAAVSSKPQTTRGHIPGLYSEEDCQWLIFDTAGMIKFDQKGKKSFLHQQMTRDIYRFGDQANILCFLISLDQFKNKPEDKFPIILTPLLREAIEAFENFTGNPEKKVSCQLILSKKDSLKQKYIDIVETLLAKALEDKNLNFPIEVVVLSAKNKIDLKDFCQKLKTLTPQGNFEYPDDILTTKSSQTVVKEYIKEQIFRLCHQEIPYRTAIDVEKWKESVNFAKIYVSIICENPRQRSILIGESGKMIRSIRENSEKSMSQFMDKKCYLQIHIKTLPNWYNKESLTQQFENFNT